MTDPIDTARQEGIALGLAMAAKKIVDHGENLRAMAPGYPDGSAQRASVLGKGGILIDQGRAILALAPIPPFTRCPTCGGVSLRLAPGRPVTCAFCGKDRPNG